MGNIGAGLVADAVGRANLRWLFVVDAATRFGCALIVYFGLPPDRRSSPHSCARTQDATRRNPVRGASAWRDPALLAMTAAGTVFATVSMLVLVACCLLAVDGLDPAAATW